MPVPARRGRLVLWALLALIALWSEAARAAVTVPTPAGWSRAGIAEDARARVEGWAAQAGGKVDSIATPRSDDDYTEVLAVIELGGALPAPALAAEPGEHAVAALLYDAQALLGVEGDPSASGRVELRDPDLAALWGRWDVGEETFYLALAPAGRTHAAIVLAIQSHDSVLYESVFTDLLPQIDDAAASVVPYPRGRWIAIAWVAWAIGAAVIAFVVARVDLALGAAAVATRTAGVLSALALAVFAIVFFSLGSQTAGLAALGVSPAWHALELAGGGVGAAILVWVGAQIFERGRKPVSSAPSDGAFAPRPISSVVDVRRRPGVGPARDFEGVPEWGPHLESRATPVVGVPILPALGERLTADARANRPRSASGSLGEHAERATVRDPLPPPPDEPPARLTPAHEPGTPQALAPDTSRPASLETEQILIERGGSRRPQD